MYFLVYRVSNKLKLENLHCEVRNKLFRITHYLESNFTSIYALVHTVVTIVHNQL